jgi:hypothetical protein
MRLERDRRGGLRVFPGAAIAALQRPVPADAPQAADGRRDEQPLIPVEPETADLDVQPADPTAELLGRAKSRRPRARAAAPEAPAKKKKAAPAKRGSRSKKAAAGDDDNIGNQ